MLYLYLFDNPTMGASSSKNASKRHKKVTGDASTTDDDDFENCPGANSLLKHSPSLALDLLIFILAVISATFLIYSYFSYFSYVFKTLPVSFPSFSLGSAVSLLYTDLQTQPFVYISSLVLAFVFVLICFEICFGRSYRKCGKAGCKGLRITKEFDVLLQGKECFKSWEYNNVVRAVNELPWKSDIEGHPFYNRLLAELKKMAPPSGRAVLIFRSKCGCPIAKIESWAPRHGPRQS